MPDHSPSLRVLNIFFDDRFGGPQKRAIEVAKILVRDGVDTIVCIPAGEGNTADIAQEAGVLAIRIPFEHIPRPQNLGRLLNWIFLLPRDIRRFMRAYRHERLDIVHVNGAFFIAPAIAAKLAGVPLLWHLNDTMTPSKVAAVLGFFVRLLANQIVVAAYAVANHYKVTPHQVIYAPVNTKRFIPRTTQKQKSKTQRIGLIANWNPNKGIEYFVRAAALVRKSIGGELEVIFAGEKLSNQSEYCHYIEGLIGELKLTPCTRDHGFIPSVAGLLEKLDVLVLSSLSEACPIAILEGMAAGVPVVAADVGGVRELILPDTDNSAGIVVPAKDPKAMAAAILELLNNPNEAARKGRNGRQSAEKNFSLEFCAQKHLKVYQRLRG